MKKSLILSLLTIILFGGFTNETFSQKMKQGKFNMVKNELNLTESQQKTINDLRYEHQLAVLDIRNEIAKNRLEIQNMMQNNNLDEKRFKELSSANTDLDSKLKNMKTDHWLAVYKVLDENQKKIWAQDFCRMDREHNKKGKGNFRPQMRRPRNMMPPQMPVPPMDDTEDEGFEE